MLTIIQMSEVSVDEKQSQWCQNKQKGLHHSKSDVSNAKRSTRNETNCCLKAYSNIFIHCSEANIVRVHTTFEFDRSHFVLCEEINARTMASITKTVEMQEALYCRNPHYYTNNSFAVSPFTMASMLGALMSMYECAIPFKSSKKCSVKSEEEEGDANNDSVDESGHGQRIGFECPVCLRNVDDLQTFAISCGHWCCSDCIQHAIAQRQSCPLCNTAANSNSLIRIFLP
ncbi:uncharacterized protein LOC129576278 [Sitodiplosis mosellana]|uniref:uncharacterized protein LOC129576278 n=1 Tax=Sitodiplosis mosellana TaxID=263140 RepID=UPI002443DE88|nr:uncharacterized protein LOC129576278 [Sitodiplosis mosellana]